MQDIHKGFQDANQAADSKMLLESLEAVNSLGLTGDGCLNCAHPFQHNVSWMLVAASAIVLSLWHRW